MDPREFREVGHRVVDLLSGYFEHIEDKRVLPAMRTFARDAKSSSVSPTNRSVLRE